MYSVPALAPRCPREPWMTLNRGCARRRPRRSRRTRRRAGLTMNRFDLSGRIGLVTGSSRGDRFCPRQGLLQAGARVVITAATSSLPPSGDPVLADETGGQTRVSTFDVTDLAAVDRGIAAIEDDWGTPDILVNNAGLQRRRHFVEFSLEDWNERQEVGLLIGPI